MENGLGQAQVEFAGPCSHVVLHFTDTSAHQKVLILIASPSSAPMGCVAVSVSLGPTGSKPLFLESSCGMFTCTVPWRQNLALAHMLALKGGPYPGRQIRLAASPSVPYGVGPGWVTFPSTALLEDFPPSTCAGGHLHAHNDSNARAGVG